MAYYQNIGYGMPSMYSRMGRRRGMDPATMIGQAGSDLMGRIQAAEGAYRPSKDVVGGFAEAPFQAAISRLMGGPGLKERAAARRRTVEPVQAALGRLHGQTARRGFYDPSGVGQVAQRRLAPQLGGALAGLEAQWSEQERKGAETAGGLLQAPLGEAMRGRRERRTAYGQMLSRMRAPRTITRVAGMTGVGGMGTGMMRSAY